MWITNVGNHGAVWVISERSLSCIHVCVSLCMLSIWVYMCIYLCIFACAYICLYGIDDNISNIQLILEHLVLHVLYWFLLISSFLFWHFLFECDAYMLFYVWSILSGCTVVRNDNIERFSQSNRSISHFCSEWSILGMEQVHSGICELGQ